MSRLEPSLIRCSRCDALVAVQDASKCEIHETDALCPYCWKHHWQSVEREHPHMPLSEQCWALSPMPLEWRRR